MKKNQRMLITGASSGIGRGLAEYFAQKGYELYLGGLETKKQMAHFLSSLKKKSGENVFYDPTDLTDGLLVRSMVERAILKMGAIDFLVNNAGIQHVSPIQSFPVEMWEAILSVNLSSSFHTIASVIPHMENAQFGRIINISSVHGLVASKNKSAYVAAKHGLIGLTKVVALEQACGPITCNSICPGWVKTPLVEEQIRHRAQHNSTTIQTEETSLLFEKQPSGKFVSIKDIAEMVAFLCGSAASNITGSCFVMDGGWTSQ